LAGIDCPSPQRPARVLTCTFKTYAYDARIHLY
jgi:hypothetical protein